MGQVVSPRFVSNQNVKCDGSCGRLVFHWITAIQNRCNVNAQLTRLNVLDFEERH